jgi:hypothetical protein
MTAKIPAKPKGMPRRKSTVTKKAKASPPPKAKRGRKSDQIQAEQILQEVIFLLANLLGRQNILKHVGEKWGLCDNTIDGYIAKARAVLRESGSIDRNTAIGQSQERIKEIRGLAKKKGDIQSLVGVERLLIKITVPERVEVSGTPGGEAIKTEAVGNHVMTPQDVLAVAEILKAAGVTGSKDNAAPRTE